MSEQIDTSAWLRTEVWSRHVGEQPYEQLHLRVSFKIDKRALNKDKDMIELADRLGKTPLCIAHDSLKAFHKALENRPKSWLE